MGTIQDKINKALSSKSDIKAAIEAKGVSDVGDVLSTYADKISSIQSGASDYELESQMLILPVGSTTITTKSGGTAAVATNDHIKIVDEDLRHYTVKEWNDRSVANGFDNSLVPKPIGFSMECNGVRVIVRWPFVGTIWNCLGTANSSNTMQHSIYEYDQITAAKSGTDYHSTTDESIGTNALGSHSSADWKITDNGDSLTLYCGNTKQSWNIAKDCGNANFMVAFNYKERCKALIAQNEWMRHRFAICSGIQTSEVDGTIVGVDILNVSGNQASVGEDMYFYINGQNTTLKARYNVNNRHNVNSYYLTDEIAEYIYSKQVENGINMNDTGVNSAEKPILIEGAKGAEAIAVNGYWYIITPYVSRPNGSQTSFDYNILDSPAVYYCNSLGDGYRLVGDSELFPIWTNKNIINGLINYLRTYEERTEEVPSYNSGYSWSCVRSNSNVAWYVYLGNGNCISNNTSGRYAVWAVSAF